MGRGRERFGERERERVRERQEKRKRERERERGKERRRTWESVTQGCFTADFITQHPQRILQLCVFSGKPSRQAFRGT